MTVGRFTTVDNAADTKWFINFMDEANEYWTSAAARAATRENWRNEVPRSQEQTA